MTFRPCAAAAAGFSLGLEQRVRSWESGNPSPPCVGRKGESQGGEEGGGPRMEFLLLTSWRGSSKTRERFCPFPELGQGPPVLNEWIVLLP